MNNIHGGLSSLTWNPERKNLFGVTDHPSSIIELSQDGKVIRVIFSDVDHDFESIEWIGNDRYIVSHRVGSLTAAACYGLRLPL
ncbi:SdiA-regulated domain-containing protein [Escherichia coli]|uniref:SdiA-regulated domain-containing protein n=1 Tax=Escherichia coli TaxID=562 RepID=UPI003C789C68